LLEIWLRADLIDRTVQPVTLTNAGEAFKPVALEIVLLAYQSRDNIFSQVSAYVGKIRFSTVCTLAQFFVPGWLKQLQPLAACRTQLVLLRPPYRDRPFAVDI
jgi:DNA-binding transcriptional LysR family regulator